MRYCQTLLLQIFQDFAEGILWKFKIFVLFTFSLRYHALHPKYITERITQLGYTYDLRVVLVQVDVVSLVVELDCVHDSCK